MAFTEVQRRGRRKYYYRVRSVRKDGKVTKERVFLGTNLRPPDLKKKERRADRELGLLSELLTQQDQTFLDRVRAAYAKEPRSTTQNRYGAFVAQLTYDSNAIEGNTLTLDETSQLLFEGLVPAKSLREVHEALNHKSAFDQALAYRGDVTKKFICRLHEIVVKDTLPVDLDSQIGGYRDVQVYIRGVDWVPAKPKDVPKDMKALLEWYTKNKKKLHPVVVSAYFHTGFELVHPFVDGNGRVGRLLMNFILHRNGYPMVNIPKVRRREYYAALHKGQVEGDLRPFVSLLIDEYRRSPLRF
ncbi:MAG TPA: Fic family protein [Candidatus Thermoplasmatota archaeon]|nr:Fic family protein [Candidatus Thermoplasmatota archaeon]